MYENDPHVVRLSSSTFSHVVRGQEGGAAYAVEFFAPWCGHCQAFAPVWSAMAAASCAAAPVLQLAAVDCVAESTLCRQQQIQSFPTVKLFVPGQTSALGQRLAKCEHGCRSQPEMLGAILSTVASAQSPGGLAKLLGEGVDGILNRSASCAILVPTRSIATTSSSAWRSQQQQQLGYASTLQMGEAPTEQLLRPLPVDDAALAALYGFKHELFRAPTSAGSARHLATQRWLELLATALPGDSRHAALSRLAVHAQGVTTPTGWQALLQPPLAMALLPRQAWQAWLGRGTPRWAACRGWSPESRGFPCGLWNLFHTVLAHSNDSARALIAIEGYVEHAFGCAECAAHFHSLVESTSDPPPDGVHAPSTTPQAAALWLWRAHNAVNGRLNQSSEAAVLTLGLRKLQWPDSHACPQCRDAGGRWRKGAVLKHLRAAYCRGALAPCAHWVPHAGATDGGDVERASAAADEDGRRTMAAIGGDGGGTGLWATAGYALLLALALILAVSRTRCMRRLRLRAASPRLEELTPVNVCAYHALHPSRD